MAWSDAARAAAAHSHGGGGGKRRFAAGSLVSKVKSRTGSRSPKYSAQKKGTERVQKNRKALASFIKTRRATGTGRGSDRLLGPAIKSR